VSASSGSLEPAAVRAMFDRISSVYDLMNRLMTFGLDRGWRDLTAHRVVKSGDRVLDAACGTGDLALADQRAGGRSVVGLDFSEPMLERARRKSRTIDWVQGELSSLPFPDASFDTATIGFGIRNVSDRALVLGELRRVLAPGGRLGVLEITPPRGPLAPFFALWLDRLVPVAGRLVSGDSAYTYLPASVHRFPSAEAFARELAAAGLTDIRYRLLAGGIVALHVGVAR
jgi:demethylmenaquinone methyltransferase/2-methoxy-6-polyprenyl-1,4-benzoquinol methylase